MSAFLTHLIVDDESGPPVTLVAPLVYRSDGLKRTITVPSGFRTDFASIPPIVPGWLLPKEGPYDKPSVIHDWHYATGSVTRQQADDCLREGCLVCGVSAWQARLIWIGVRMGGWVPWNRYRRAPPVTVPSDRNG